MKIETLLSFVRMLWQRRDLVAILSRREIDLKYKGTGLGVAWAVVGLSVQLFIYTFVFGFIFNARWNVEHGNGIAGYAVILFAGLVSFSVFSETISRAGTSISSASYLVKKVLFPIELLPVATLIAALFHASVGLALIVLIFVFKLQIPEWTIILVPIVILPLVLFTLGVAWIIAALGVFIKDTQFITNLFTQLLFFASPIIYPPDIIPDRFQWVILLNPMSHCIEMFRQVVLFGEVPDVFSWLVLTVFCAFVASIGFYLFSGMKREFADVI